MTIVKKSLLIQPNGQSNRGFKHDMAQSKPSSNSASKAKTAGSRWGTRWVSSSDQFTISWPTVPFAGTAGWFGLLAAIAIGVFDYYIPVKFQPRSFQPLWFWTLVVAILSILMLVSSQLLRESFTINWTKAERTRWPDCFRPRQAVPFKQVVGVVVQYNEALDDDSSPSGYVRVRVRRSEGIEWWSIGSDLGWGEAGAIGKCLDRFATVRTFQERD